MGSKIQESRGIEQDIEDQEGVKKAKKCEKNSPPFMPVPFLQFKVSLENHKLAQSRSKQQWGPTERTLEPDDDDETVLL